VSDRLVRFPGSQTRRPAPAPRPAVAETGPASAPLEPQTLWTAVGAAAPAGTLFVSEAGSNESTISACIRPGTPFSHLYAAGGGLGFGLPAAVGAQLAAPDRPVVALMGDGSMHYAITALPHPPTADAPGSLPDWSQ
jgi:benzoylformate decarboxylase